jgi:hypothetical protein
MVSFAPSVGRGVYYSNEDPVSWLSKGADFKVCQDPNSSYKLKWDEKTHLLDLEITSTGTCIISWPTLTEITTVRVSYPEQSVPQTVDIQSNESKTSFRMELDPEEDFIMVHMTSASRTVSLKVYRFSSNFNSSCMNTCFQKSSLDPPKLNWIIFP